MTDKTRAEVYRYAFNLFAFPDGYFKDKSAEDLGISEEARSELISMQSARTDGENAEDRKKLRLKEFMVELEE